MKVCFRCGSRLRKEKVVTDYPLYCPSCDENMFNFEAREGKPKRYKFYKKTE